MGLAQPLPAVAICPYFGKDMLSKGQAKKTAKGMQRRTGENISAYKCRTCGKWHVGQRRNF